MAEQAVCLFFSHPALPGMVHSGPLPGGCGVPSLPCRGSRVAGIHPCYLRGASGLASGRIRGDRSSSEKGFAPHQALPGTVQLGPLPWTGSVPSLQCLCSGVAWSCPRYLRDRAVCTPVGLGEVRRWAASHLDAGAPALGAFFVLPVGGSHPQDALSLTGLEFSTDYWGPWGT